MFVEVPEPVWKTSIGNCSSCLPSATSAARRDPLGELGVEQAEIGVHARGVALDGPSQRTTRSGTRSPEPGKLATAFVVSPPHSFIV